MTDAASDPNRVSALLRDLPAFLHLVQDTRLHAEADELLALRSRVDELPSADLGRLFEAIVAFAQRAGIGPLLALHEIPEPPPGVEVEQPSQPKSSPRWTLLGQQIGFPIGVPASNQTARSDWATFYARKRYNVLTFRTVRSAAQKRHPQPNLFFLPALRRPLVPDDPLPTLQIGEHSASPKDLDLRAVTTAHSFGVPSPSPKDWQADVERTGRALASDQLLIVAVLGTSKTGDLAELKRDFSKVSGMAQDVGAAAIELNLHCALVYDSARGVMVPVCEVPSATVELVTAVRRSLRRETRLVLKLGYVDAPTLASIIVPLSSRRQFDAISGINPVRATVQADEEGTTVFLGRDDDATASRLQAGVSGVAIQKFGFTFVRRVAQIRRLYGLDYEIIAMGGVMDLADVSTYFALGANAVQTATASLFFPDLAVKAMQRLGTEFRGGESPAEPALTRSRVPQLIADAEYELASDPPVRHVKSKRTLVTSVRRTPQELLMSREEIQLLVEEDDAGG